MNSLIRKCERDFAPCQPLFQSHHAVSRSLRSRITHVPLFAHPNPKSVLIVGAGDGGVLREIVKHSGVEKIVMCEIDEDVVTVSKRFFPTTMATAFDDPRVELLFMDAALYMKAHAGEFDCIIVDSSDPVGPAETLYTSSFYADMKACLRPGGIVCTQVSHRSR
jgi:spermidine synthase